MRIAIIGDPSRREKDAPIIESANKIFDEELYVPITGVRIETGDENSKVVYNKKDLSSFDCILPIPSSKYLDMFLSIIKILSPCAYLPYGVKSLLLFSKNMLALSKLEEKGFAVLKMYYSISDKGIEASIPKISFPTEITIGTRSSVVDDEKHLRGMIKLRRPGQGILIQEPVVYPITSCLVLKKDVVASVMIENGRSGRKEKKKMSSINIGSELKEIAINAIATLDSDYGLVSFTNKNKIINLSLSPDFSAIEKATAKGVASLLLNHMLESAKVRIKKKKKGFWKRLLRKKKR